MEERVRRLQAASFAMASDTGIRSHRLWTSVDRRAAPLAVIALFAVDRRRARRHHAVRSVLRQCHTGDRSRQEAQRQSEAGLGTVAARTRRRGRAHGREYPDRAMGAAMPGAAGLVLPLGAGTAGDP